MPIPGLKILQIPAVLATDLTAELKSAATALGFELVGVCPAVAPEGVYRLYDWIDAGLPGEMHYFASRRQAYADPSAVLAGVRSIVMLAMRYGQADDADVAAGLGRVARYARGRDYHNVLWEKLEQLAVKLSELAPGSRSRGVVDTAPLLERDFAQLAGLGWVGKNTLLLNKTQGSWFVLGALLTDIELDYDAPHEADHCGTCTACLDACPTNAFLEPYQLDPRRCISYLTIEHRSAIPMELRAGIGDWVFGCDVCQEVCPWNNKAPVDLQSPLGMRRDLDTLELTSLFELSDDQWRSRFRDTPLWRPKRRGILRNAAIVLGNQRNSASLPALLKALDDSEPLVRGAVAWAVGQIGAEAVITALNRRLSVEDDQYVRGELLAAIDGVSQPSSD